MGTFTLSRGLPRSRPAGFSFALALHPRICKPTRGFRVLLLVVWLISPLLLLSRVDLSYVLSVTSVSYVLTVLMGEFLLP
jgi:hypothetical protein